MSATKRGLGKGLSALITTSTKLGAEKESLVSAKSIVSVPTGDIVPNPRQPRHRFKEESLKELAESIKEHGIAQPLLVRKAAQGYELVAGERRLRAAVKAGLAAVPVIIKAISDEESLELAIIENVQREDLNSIDEAESYLLLMREFDLKQEEVAHKVGKARSSIANALRLLDLPAEIKESIRDEEISAGHARAILAAGDLNAQLSLWRKIKKDALNVRDAESLAVTVSTKKGKKKSDKKKIEALSNIEQELSSRFSTKVNLSGTEHKGSIEIKYFSRDDLERIYELLSK